jgi:hypothetical protein
MLRTMHELKSYVIGASDGDVGHVSDSFFDDEDWVIRYLVVETGSWLNSRKVLISPYAVGDADWGAHRLPVRISKEQVKNSPDIDTEKPVSRQHEAVYADYYGYPYYWEGGGYWGGDMYYPTLPLREPSGDNIKGQRHKATEDPHLRSCQAVVGYRVHASDGELGHVSSMLVDEETWAIRYLVVDTSNWWMGHQVLISPQWITGIRWYQSSVDIDLTRENIQGSPVFESSDALNRQHELDLYRYYDRPNYWEREKQREFEQI